MLFAVAQISFGQERCRCVVVGEERATKDRGVGFLILGNERDAPLDFSDARTRVDPAFVVGTIGADFGSLVGDLLIFKLDSSGVGDSIPDPDVNFFSHRFLRINGEVGLNRRRSAETLPWKMFANIALNVFWGISKGFAIVDSVVCNIGY